MLEGTAKKLASWPTYYLKVVGHARAEGDPEANRLLAQARAESVRAYLELKGIPTNRLRSEATEPKEAGGGGQSVTFILGETRY